MNVLTLAWRELRHRQIAALLTTCAVAAAVAPWVGLAMLQDAASRETRRTMRDMGFNIRIVPRETDEGRFHLDRYSHHTMPVETVHRLAAASNISYNHLVATLRRRVQLGSFEALVVGISGTLFPTGKKKPPMIFEVDPGTVHVGSLVASGLGLRKGASLELGGESFRVERVMAESGSQEDITVYGLLSDVQRVLGLANRINEIQAIDCLCKAADEDPLADLRRELSEVLPEAKVLHLSRIADARAKQRRMVDAQAAVTLPFIVFACALGIGILTILNVRERREEIGVLRALGFGSFSVAGLFLVRSVVLGVAGGVVGYGLGTALTLSVGARIYQVTAAAIRPDGVLLGAALLGAPLFAALASFIPAMRAVVQDPARTLRQE